LVAEVVRSPPQEEAGQTVLQDQTAVGTGVDIGDGQAVRERSMA
jgi:hypothetical protein